MGDPSPVQTSAARTSFSTRSGQALANPPARRAPEDDPKKQNDFFPVIFSTIDAAAFNVLYTVGNIGKAVCVSRFTVAFMIHCPDVIPEPGEGPHQRVIALAGDVEIIGCARREG